MEENSEFGNFVIEYDDIDSLTDMDQFEDDEELFSTLDMNFLDFLASTKPTATETARMKEELKQPEMDLPPTRFHTINEDQMRALEENRQSKSTKSNTKWATKIFQDWHVSTYGTPFEVQTVSEEDLAQILRKFYCEARPKDSEMIYHKNTMKNIRAAINRFIQDNGRNIDIIRGPAFKSANNTLDGLLKEQTRLGLSRPTLHKNIIEEEDLCKISKYMSRASESALILRQSVWMNLAIHFVSRGLEFYHQLKINSFDFQFDEFGKEYATINHETQQKNFQGGLSKDEAPVDRRMYATGDENCPVQALKLLISKTHKDATSLFNNCFREALTCPNTVSVWYDTKGLAKRTFSNFMADICKSSKLSKSYTPHCLRATAIQAMNDRGFSSRHIMFMSGHRCEASLKSYSRNPSAQQKKALSSTLSKVIKPDSAQKSVDIPQSTTSLYTPPISESESMYLVSDSLSNRNTSLANMSYQNENNLSSLFQSGSFQGCTFNISLNQQK